MVACPSHVLVQKEFARGTGNGEMLRDLVCLALTIIGSGLGGLTILPEGLVTKGVCKHVKGAISDVSEKEEEGSIPGGSTIGASGRR